MKKRLALGPVMLDVSGAALTDEDRRRLQHPLVGGVILFGRNYQSPEQIAALCAEIHALREPQLLIAVDHEGGRVQRFREGFSSIPAMRRLGSLWDKEASLAVRFAEDIGWLIATELGACGVDFSFAPVLDLDFGSSAVIGDRAFHRDPQAVAALGAALIDGLRSGGMAAVGKHFPGHGYVAADSHLDVPVDDRSLEEMLREDLVPFARLARAGLAGVMPAHVVYPKVDEQPAGYSRVWLREILRRQLGFRGVIFSDDLSMEGARVAGGIVQRGRAALAAGCDMILVCNRPAAADDLLESLDAVDARRDLGSRLAALQARPKTPSFAQVRELPRHQRAVAAIAALGEDATRRIA